MFFEATTNIAQGVTRAIREAARATGAGFDYLLKTAMRESSLDPSARASSSSATGLFQFVDQTWLATVKEAGPGLGYGQYAQAITRQSNGRYVVSDPAMRDTIMNLRFDPTANAVMAGAFTQRNASELAEGIGRPPSDGELYIAHFLGSGGAIKLIGQAARQPQASAAKLFPEAARANRAIFYDGNGAPRSVAEVYQVLVAKHDNARTAPSGLPAEALAAQEAQPLSASTTAYTGDRSPVYALFQDERSGPLSPLVTQLWGPRRAAPVASVAAANPPVAETASSANGRIGRGPLDLFRFLRPEIQATQNRSV
jgi:hypothetical protein